MVKEVELLSKNKNKQKTQERKILKHAPQPRYSLKCASVPTFEKKANEILEITDLQ